MSDALAPFSIGWPVSRDDGLDDLTRFLREPGFRPRFRLPGGQFALCERDERSGRVVVLRDPSATMPLHAHYDGRQWLVSYSVRAIEDVVGRKFPLKFETLKTLHQKSLLNPGESIYHEVELCAPGVVHVFEPGGKVHRSPVKIEWPDNINVDRSLWGDIDALAAAAADSVSHSIMDAAGADQAIVQQSGGLDSNLILHAGVRAGLKLAAQGMVFPGLDCDESAAMRASAEMAGVAYDPVDFAGQDYAFWKEELFLRSEYPPFTTSFMPLAMAQRAKRMGFRVMLSGMGGDELFATSRTGGQAFLARLNLAPGMLHLGPKDVNQYARALARRLVSGRQKSLSPYLHSGSWHFQMCAIQMALDEGISLRLPFCDWRMVVAVRPLTALSAVVGHPRRSLQRALLNAFTPGTASRVGVHKVDFSAVGAETAVGAPNSELGTARFSRFETLIPDFIRFKCRQGRKSMD